MWFVPGVLFFSTTGQFMPTTSTFPTGTSSQFVTKSVPVLYSNQMYSAHTCTEGPESHVPHMSTVQCQLRS